MRAWGVDGCKDGWFFFGLDDGDPEYGVVPELGNLLDRIDAEADVLVDIPIGLLDSGDRERLCDLEARRILSPRRASSVFPAPCRPAVYAGDYEEAQRRNRAALGKGLSKQSWAISPKIREVDELLQSRSDSRRQVREVHPEVCFWALVGHPMLHSKKTREGFRERLAALEPHVSNAAELVATAFLEHGGFEAQRDDIIDALVAALCASRINQCSTLPAELELDPSGLPMEMVYWQPISVQKHG